MSMAMPVASRKTEKPIAASAKVIPRSPLGLASGGSDCHLTPRLPLKDAAINFFIMPISQSAPVVMSDSHCEPDLYSKNLLLRNRVKLSFPTQVGPQRHRDTERWNRVVFKLLHLCLSVAKLFPSRS